MSSRNSYIYLTAKFLEVLYFSLHKRKNSERDIIKCFNNFLKNLYGYATDSYPCYIATDVPKIFQNV